MMWHTKLIRRMINVPAFYVLMCLDPEAKARASGSEREMGQARARENFSRSEREK